MKPIQSHILQAYRTSQGFQTTRDSHIKDPVRTTSFAPIAKYPLYDESGTYMLRIAVFSKIWKLPFFSHGRGSSNAQLDFGGDDGPSAPS